MPHGTQDSRCGITCGHPDRGRSALALQRKRSNYSWRLCRKKGSGTLCIVVLPAAYTIRRIQTPSLGKPFVADGSAQAALRRRAVRGAAAAILRQPASGGADGGVESVASVSVMTTV